MPQFERPKLLEKFRNRNKDSTDSEQGFGLGIWPWPILSKLKENK